MESKEFGNKFVIRIDKGEEIIGTLTTFCKDNNIKLGTITGIGSTKKATIGLFDTQSKKYHSIELTGDYEIDQLTGNICTMNGKIYIHAHVNLSDISYKTFGGHLNSAIVSGTFETVIDAINGDVGREFSETIGLNLFKM